MEVQLYYPLMNMDKIMTSKYLTSLKKLTRVVGKCFQFHSVNQSVLIFVISLNLED